MLAGAISWAMSVARRCPLFARMRFGRRSIPLLFAVFTACTTLTSSPPLTGVQPRPLGYVAHLAEGDPAALPAGVAAAVAATAELAFRYKEQVYQDDNSPPAPLELLLGPIFLLGVPTGSYQVTVSAELTVWRGSQELARYEGAATASRPYGLYYGSTVRELEMQARMQARRVIDEALYKNADQLAAMRRS